MSINKNQVSMADLLFDNTTSDCCEAVNNNVSKSVIEKESKKKGSTIKEKHKNFLIKETGWKIAYATQTFNVAEFFNDLIPESGLTLEQIREQMELEFAEFSKSRTHWEIDEERKMLFPIIRGESKGSLRTGLKQFFWRKKEFEAVDINKRKKINLFASQNGLIYEQYGNRMGTITTPVSHIKELDKIESSFVFHLPKVPGVLLNQIINFFRYYCEKPGGPYEVMVELYFDQKNNEYFIKVPQQKVSISNIVYDSTFQDFKDHILVMHIHSHHYMKAEFSEKDDLDEQAFLIYGVIGTLNSEILGINFRAGKSGSFIKVNINDLFEFDQRSSIPSFPTEWTNKVTTE
ncbi:putative uncharacterized protein [Brevibacillus laterosporus GI-9]|uniref:hypothetical protein n=1 Tax=Brevibacillus laterosporus TaxID=1465 RepID=UPI0002405249|nr:hypothetical protein [Brevibacillus laterosporus]CCF16727.1 putative uncharacterized protein [Brevibacillus laterosporus GI-9]